MDALPRRFEILWTPGSIPSVGLIRAGAALSLTLTRLPCRLWFLYQLSFGRPYRRRRLMVRRRWRIWSTPTTSIDFLMTRPFSLTPGSKSSAPCCVSVGFEFHSRPPLIRLIWTQLFFPAPRGGARLRRSSGDLRIEPARRLNWSHTPADVYRAAGHLKDARISVGLNLCGAPWRNPGRPGREHGDGACHRPERGGGHPGRSGLTGFVSKRLGAGRWWICGRRVRNSWTPCLAGTRCSGGLDALFWWFCPGPAQRPPSLYCWPARKATASGVCKCPLEECLTKELEVLR